MLQPTNSKEIIDKLGSLHDCVVETFLWSPERKTATFHVRNIFANFLGSPEYPGVKSADITFDGVTKLNIEFSSLDKTMNIDELQSENSELELNVAIRFWPEGKISLSCDSVHLSEPADEIFGLLKHS